MPATATAYLVVRREDGFGDVFPLTPGQRYTLGRAPTSRVVLPDDLCSREHAEVYHAVGRWRVRDLNSLNGTRFKGELLEGEGELTAGDEVALGRTQLLFVEDLSQLPDLPASPPPAEGVVTRKRLGHTRFLPPAPPEPDAADAAGDPGRRHAVTRDMARLYRL